MGTKSREVIWGGQVMGAKIRAESAPKRAKEAAREADRTEAHAWSLRMEGFGGPAQPSPTIGQCLNGGYGYLEVKCHRCETRASLPLNAIQRPRDTPIWKLEAAPKCRSCRKGRYAPPVHMIKLTEKREITPYKWVHPDEDRRNGFRSDGFTKVPMSPSPAARPGWPRRLRRWGHFTPVAYGTGMHQSVDLIISPHDHLEFLSLNPEVFRGFR